jgi:hypothetical protein
MAQRERPRGVRLGIDVEADALLSASGKLAYSIAVNRAQEASSPEMARDWGFVAATIARRSGRRLSVLNAFFGRGSDESALRCTWEWTEDVLWDISLRSRGCRSVPA